ncbi:hypothetical protein [Polaromonas sp. CG9_12]|nr:hypothetical protein [Polaromonas sp. CG9_12]
MGKVLMCMMDLEIVPPVASSDKNVVYVLYCDKKSNLNVSGVTKTTFFVTKNSFHDLARNLQ